MNILDESDLFKQIKTLLDDGKVNEVVEIYVDHGNKLSSQKQFNEAAQAFISAGLLLNEIGDNEKALEFHKKSLELMNLTTSEEEQLADVFYNLCITYNNLEDYDTAISYCQTALNAYEEKKDKAGIADTYYGLALSYSGLNESEKSIEYLKKAARIYGSKEINNQEAIASVNLEIGNEYFRMDDTENAIKFYKKSITISKKIEDKENLSIAYSLLGEVHEINEDPKNACTYYLKAAEMSLEANIPDSEVIVEEMIDRIESHLSDLPKSTKKRIRREVEEIKHKIERGT